jgi:hypothetical protein
MLGTGGAIVASWAIGAAAAISALLVMAGGATAQEPGAVTPLPNLAACGGSAHPEAPVKWRGAYLMAPFTFAQLTLGEFTFDESIPALRVRLHGVRRGLTDILITGSKTYLLARDGNSDACLSLGDTGLRPFSRDWLTRGSQCDGSAALAGVAADWWKSPGGSASSASRFWFDAPDAPPFRAMFVQPSKEPALLGWYAFSYRVRFERLQETDLPSIVAACQSKQHSATQSGQAALRKLLAAMDASQFRADADLVRLMPELAACPGEPLPRWPERAALSALMTTPNIEDRPMPTEVLYDWPRKLQRTRLFERQNADLFAVEALLDEKGGYAIDRASGGRTACAAGLPGLVRPNWPETGGCSCEAAIGANTPLTPYGPVRILVCRMAAPRVLWSWFAESGRPQVFMQTFAPGDDTYGMLALADYYSWLPGALPADAAIEVPAQCPAEKTAGRIWEGKSCGSCHLGIGSAR